MRSRTIMGRSKLVARQAPSGEQENANFDPEVARPPMASSLRADGKAEGRKQTRGLTAYEARRPILQLVRPECPDRDGGGSERWVNVGPGERTSCVLPATTREPGTRPNGRSAHNLPPSHPAGSSQRQSMRQGKGEISYHDVFTTDMPKGAYRK